MPTYQVYDQQPTEHESSSDHVWSLSSIIRPSLISRRREFLSSGMTAVRSVHGARRAADHMAKSKLVAFPVLVSVL